MREKYYELSANSGNIEYMIKAASMYKIGDGIPQNKRKAFEYFIKDAKSYNDYYSYDHSNRDKSERLIVNILIGAMFYTGDGLPLDKERAFR